MDQEIVRKVLDDPEFRHMARRKAVLGWSFSALMVIVYAVFILFIGISPHTFGIPVSPGSVTTWGIYVGLFVIVFAFAITGIYVHKANGEFEQMTQAVVKKVKGE